MPTLIHKDAIMMAHDLGELVAMNVMFPAHLDANIHNAPDTTRRQEQFVPWLYDYDYGWTPQREAADPRPELQMPPYFRANFPLRTSTLANAHHNAIRINLEPFPAQARVFAVVPTKVLPAALAKKILNGSTHKVGPGVEVVRTIGEFNLIFDKKLTSAATTSKVVLELQPGRMALLNDLRLGTDLVVLEFYYAMARAFVKPKTYYTLQALQLTDHRLVGRFDHIFQAYHQYDIAVIGDRRTMLAYRRSSKEVAEIPPMAIAFFDSWEQALGAGYTPYPRSFARHFTPEAISEKLKAQILAFFNKASVKAIVAKVQDNPYVDALGHKEADPERKRGIDSKTAARIVSARKKLRRKGFTRLDQIDAVKGVGPDTLSDIISSFLEDRRKKPGRSSDAKWQPDPKVLALLMPKKKVRKKKTKKKATRKKAKKK